LGEGSSSHGASGFSTHRGLFGNPSQSPVSQKQDAHGLRTGARVFHNKFGEGTVLSLEGSGDDARAQINFPRHGVKWLALSVAKLTPVP